MKTLVYTLILVLSSWSCNPQQKKAAINNLTANEFKAALESQSPKQLIDVRTDEEVNSGVIANAHQLNMANPDFDQQLDKLDKNTPVYLYCAVGGRSAQAAQILAQKGFKEINNLDGGIQGWVLAGYPINSINR